jgi:hypothetical protein
MYFTKQTSHFLDKIPHTTAGTRTSISSGQFYSLYRTYLLTYLHTYLPTYLPNYLTTYSMEQSSLEKLTGPQPVKKFPASYTTRRFITAFTNVRHLSLSWASSIQSITSHPTSWRYIWKSSQLRLGLPSSLFPSGFPTKTLHTPLLLPTRATRPAHLFFFDFITRTILVQIIHKEKSNKMQQCIKTLLFHFCTKLSMFRVTHRPSSGA